MERTAEAVQCGERVVRALALAEQLSLLPSAPTACSHHACALLERLAQETAAELRRVAARAGLNLAGQQLVQPLAPRGAAEEPNTREGSDEVSSTPTK